MKKLLVAALFSGLLVGCGGDKSEALVSETPVDSHETKGEPFTVPGLEMEMLWCRPGTLTIGSPGRAVTLTKGFWLGKYEVTQAQYETIMGSNPSDFKGANLPVELVSWNDATAFCVKLTERERRVGRLPYGWEYALPTEAQWEYACRAGTTTAYSFGDAITEKQANFGRNIGQTTSVGYYPANAWGFHDMHGNVKEWCSDWWTYPRGSVTDPTGPASGSYRVSRGGSWSNTGPGLRSAGGTLPGTRSNNLGFRVGLKASQ